MRKPKHPMPKEITALKLRHNLGEILDQVANQHERFLVKRSGIPAAIILSLADYDDLQELFDTWQEQENPKFQQSLHDARQEIEDGKTATLEDLRQDLDTKKQKGKRKTTKR